jgi:hypothetical protein
MRRGNIHQEDFPRHRPGHRSTGGYYRKPHRRPPSDSIRVASVSKKCIVALNDWLKPEQEPRIRI